MIPTLNVFSFIFFLPESLLLEWLCKTYTCLQEKYLVGVSLGSPADQLTQFDPQILISDVCDGKIKY
jgi:hypothetical protein